MKGIGVGQGVRAYGLVLLLGVGCSPTDPGEGPSPGCPSDLPPSCPAAVPSYQSDIAPLVQRRCLACHEAGGVEASRPLDTYGSLYSQRSAVLNQVYGCTMPPTTAAQPDATERRRLLTWLVCRAPNN